jgi:hypothetical protein
VSVEPFNQSVLPAAPTRVGQATHVEQARAVAEVMAAVQVAQANPRDINRARAEMRRSCSEYGLADEAFFRYSRGNKTVTGPTVKLARELKRCFGNFQSGHAELRRDDEYGQSEMQAWAWDVETNSRSVSTFVVPHANYMTGTALTALRDIYENNANQGSRREREMVLGLLPAWFVAEAVSICRDTIVKGNGDPLVVRQDKAEAAMKSLGIDLSRVERKVGRPKAQWSPMDLAELTVDYQSIRTGEIRAEEVFPPTELQVEDLAPPRQDQGPVGPVKWQKPVTVTAEQVGEPPAGEQVQSGRMGDMPSHGHSISGQGPAADAAPAAPAPQLATAPGSITSRQVVKLNERFAEMPVRGTGQAYARMRVARALVRRDLEALTDLSEQEAGFVLDNLTGDSGLRAVAEILTEDKAPEHLIPPVPAPVDDDVPEEPAADGVAVVEGYSTGDEVDPTVEPAWTGDGEQQA